MNAPIDITGIELRTERLLLRPWRESDLVRENTFYIVHPSDKTGLFHPDAQGRLRACAAALVCDRKCLYASTTST